MSTKAIRADQAHEYVGRYVVAMFTDGWDERPIDGTLMSVDPVQYMVYLELCSSPEDCDHTDWEPGFHGESAILNDTEVQVYMNGRPSLRMTSASTPN